MLKGGAPDAVACSMLAERLEAIAAEDLVVHHGRAGADHLVVGRAGIFLVGSDRFALQAVREALDARGLAAMPAEVIADHPELEKTVGEDRRFGLRVVTRACAALGVPDGVRFVAGLAPAEGDLHAPVAAAPGRAVVRRDGH